MKWYIIQGINESLIMSHVIERYYVPSQEDAEKLFSEHYPEYEIFNIVCSDEILGMKW